MKRRFLFGAVLAAAMSSAMPAARADVMIGCDTLTTLGGWSLTRGCALGDMILVLGRTRLVRELPIAFELVGNVASLTVTGPEGSALGGTLLYSVAFAEASANRVVGMQLYGTRQALAGDDDGGAIVIAFTDPDPIAIPTILELTIGNTARPVAAPEPLGAPPIPLDPSLFDSGAIDARTLQVTLDLFAGGSRRDGAIGLESVTTAFVLAAEAVPTPASLALMATGLAIGAIGRRRR